MIRTSATHPLQIAEVRAHPAHGRIGITFCPGKHDRFAMSGAWARDLNSDLDVIERWGAAIVVTLMESHELVSLKVPHLGEEISARGILWLHLPIVDFSTPTEFFELKWLKHGWTIREALRDGLNVLIHCRGGMGRAGMMAARLLVELGVGPEEAIRSVRRVRSGAIETAAQLRLVRETQPITDDTPRRIVEAAKREPILDVNRMRRVGGQLGMHSAAVFEDVEGQGYYVKTLDSRQHVQNEWLAAALYRLVGAPTLTYMKTVNPRQIATLWLTLDKRRIAHFTEAERLQAQQWFAVHAWTANWDAAGFDGDNQGVAGGKVLTLDVGGALSFSAMGDPKGRAFGTVVDELLTLRNHPHNPHATKLFSDMSHDTLRRSIARVTELEDAQITEVILNNGGEQRLVDKMLARKANMQQRLTEF